jgi:hypothetical protein
MPSYLATLVNMLPSRLFSDRENGHRRLASQASNKASGCLDNVLMTGSMLSSEPVVAMA